MIKEAYVSFELAKLLKKKGFNEDCYTYYDNIDNSINRFDKGLHFNNTSYPWGVPYDISKAKEYVVAPTNQMAIAWLRTKHIIIVVQPEYFNADGTCSYWGVDIWADDNYEKLQGDFPSYEEAIEEALKYSLENLI